MKYLAYTSYCSGGAGLSNGIMSLEIGLILAHLTNRLLILEGNESPPANVVQYPGVISNRYPSKLTDLIHLPHPWCEARDIDLTPYDSKEWVSHSLGKSVFSHPAGWEVGRKDFQSFSHGRKHLLTYTGDDAAVKVLKMSGGPEVGPHRLKMWNFSFYSYFFYLDSPHQQEMFNLLKRMTPKKPYRDFADRVVSALGPFNAVHLRRGDFKKTYGVTTLNRSPQEALEVMGHHFSPQEKLVILTDEMDDPFFEEIVAAYPDSVFLDQFILDHYREAFLDLPQHDSIALAYLSQLIAGESRDFIGSMNSTFTALIQRFRGNAGKVEPFKFLWNELPDEGADIQRGRHAASLCVPMKHGVMLDQHSGPYSWNRVHPRINPAWMREWPESFIPREGKAHGEKVAQQPHGRIIESRMADLVNHQGNGNRHSETRKLLTIHGEAISKDGNAMVFPGTADEHIRQLMKNLEKEGWTHVSVNVVTLDVGANEVIHQDGVQSDPIPCVALVLNAKASGPEDQLVPGSPGIAVGTMLSYYDRLPNDHESTVRSLCEFVESIPVYHLSFATGRQALKFLEQAHQTHTVSTAPQKNVIREDYAPERLEAPEISREATGIIPSPSIQIDNFLNPEEAQRLLAFTLNQESPWEASTVSTDTSTAIKQAPDYRNSVVLKSFNNSEFSDLIIKRVRARLPELLRELNIASYAVKEIEAQLTASNDGDFFKIHNDNGFRGGKARELTYVYYFYRIPKRFIGGELVIYDGKIENNAYARADSYKVIEPRHNSIVFFPSGCLHEVLPIRCPSQAFGDSRFTINGWVQRQKMLPPTGLPESIKEWAQKFK